MKPPICAVCGQRVTRDAALVQFADYEALPEGMVGHPEGLEWFCDDHHDAAEALRELPLKAALERMRERFG